jgi:hypothetical protein
LGQVSVGILFDSASEQFTGSIVDPESATADFFVEDDRHQELSINVYRSVKVKIFFSEMTVHLRAIASMLEFLELKR